MLFLNSALQGKWVDMSLGLTRYFRKVFFFGMFLHVMCDCACVFMYVIVGACVFMCVIVWHTHVHLCDCMYMIVRTHVFMCVNMYSCL